MNHILLFAMANEMNAFVSIRRRRDSISYDAQLDSFPIVRSITKTGQLGSIAKRRHLITVCNDSNFGGQLINSWSCQWSGMMNQTGRKQVFKSSKKLCLSWRYKWLDRLCKCRFYIYTFQLKPDSRFKMRALFNIMCWVLTFDNYLHFLCAFL